MSNKEFTVVIGLYQDRMSPKIKALILEDADYRLTSGKGCGTWDLVQKFKCSFTNKHLKQAEVKKALK